MPPYLAEMINDSNSDFNQTAARIVGPSISRSETPASPALEAAWVEWSAGVGKMDDSALVLLKAAFEAGATAPK